MAPPAPPAAPHLRPRREMREEIATSLRAPPWLAEKKRVAFYAVGAAIALLLDETSPGWKTDYFLRPFAVDGYFAP